MFFISVSMYFLSYFYRVSTAVVAHDLMSSFRIGAEQLGLLSSAYFYTFALSQFPIGPMLDRVGPRITVSTLGVVMACGSFIFAIGNSFVSCVIGRALIGLGASVACMGTFKILSNWFRPNEFGVLAAVTMALGNIGAMTATTPLALLIGWLGWQQSFMIMGIVTLFVAMMLFWYLRDYPPLIAIEQKNQASKSMGLSAMGHDFYVIFKDYNFWLISILCFFWFGSFLGVQGLWGGPYLMDVYHYSPKKAGNVLAMIAIGFLFGAPFLGFLSDRIRSRRKVIFWGLIVYTLTFIFLRKQVNLTHTWLLYPIFFSLGFFGSCGIICYAQVKELFPLKISGTAMASANFFAFAGVALFQHLIGIVIEKFPIKLHGYNQEAYKTMFFVCIVAMLIALLLYRLAHDTYAEHYPKVEQHLYNR